MKPERELYSRWKQKKHHHFTSEFVGQQRTAWTRTEKDRENPRTPTERYLLPTVEGHCLGMNITRME